MWIVSGCPRSGTSMFMDIMRTVYGENRIFGRKFPQERRDEMKKQGDLEPDHLYACRKYVIEKQEEAQEEERSFEDMNPFGFWEERYTVGGVSYHFGDREHLNKLLEETDDDMTITKIVSQGLLQSDPMYIDKIVYMIRHPRAVAKSQERLKRGFSTKFPDGKVRNIFEDLVIHTPEMYIQVTAMACRFFLAYPDIPVHFVEFEELVTKPIEILNGVQDFLGRGDFTKAHGVIEPKLNRSKHEEVENDMWEDAEYIYEKFKEGEYEAVLTYLEEPKRNFNRNKRSWHCPRYGQTVTEKQCHACRENVVVRGNFKNFAVQIQKDWINEPCLFECGYDLDREEYKTIEQSIKENFWADDKWLN